MPLWLSTLEMIPQTRRRDRRAARLIAPGLACLTIAIGLSGASFRHGVRIF